MGSVNSGRFLWRSGQLTTADCPSARINVRNMIAINKSRNDVAVIIVEQDLALLRHGVTEGYAMLEHTPCRFGGSRRWFLCPSCALRCGVLYLHEHRFACRRCHGLCYQSQCENQRGRLLRRVDAIRRRLGWPEGILSPELGRPARMHHSTYARLVAELRILTDRVLGSIEAWAEKMQQR